jgi:phospholipase C
MLKRRRRLASIAVPAAIALAAAGVRAATMNPRRSHRPTATHAAAIGHPCGWRAGPAHYSHVVWVLMENHSFGTIIGSSQAPYINSLARACGLATNYHNITHPSLPNYIAMTSGLAPSDLRSFTADCNPGVACHTAAASIFAQLRSWRAYEESMPSACLRANAAEYAVRHNPPPYFTRLAGCATHDVPYRQFASDLASGRLPSLSFLTPNLIDDMHDGTVAQGDSWLAVNLGSLLRSRLYRGGSVAVFLTWDEGEGGSASECATNVTDPGCRVAAIVISPSTPRGTRSPAMFNHYSLLRTTEQLLGLPPLGRAAGAPSMLRSFALAGR